MSKPVVAAQLFTVRMFAKTFPEIVSTLARVREIGYRSVQLSGLGPCDARELAAELGKCGLRVAGTHIAMPRLQNEIEKVIEEHRIWECRHVVIPGLADRYFSAPGLKQFVEELKPISERLNKAGLTLSYHNHDRELMRVGQRTWLEELFASTDREALKAEFDTYWIQAGGGDPADWIERHAGRLTILHVKDMRMGPDRKQQFAEVGEGNLNWPRILSAAEKGGAESLAVEQDDCYGRDPFDSLAVSYANLARWGYR